MIKQYDTIKKDNEKLKSKNENLKRITQEGTTNKNSNNDEILNDAREEMINIVI